MTAILLALAFQAGVAGQTAEVPPAAACRWLIVVMPRDEWRLTVQPDGKAWINYAQLPQTVYAPAGTFRFAELHSELKARVRPCRVQGDRAGTVDFAPPPGREKPAPWCLDDESYAAEQFERAWDTVELSAEPVVRAHLDLLRSMWERRQAPRRPLGSRP
jgi:hypothetical protein